MFNCVFVTFPFGILGQVWYFIVLIPDLCRLSYFKPQTKQMKIRNTGWKNNLIEARVNLAKALWSIYYRHGKLVILSDYLRMSEKLLTWMESIKAKHGFLLVKMNCHHYLSNCMQM